MAPNPSTNDFCSELYVRAEAGSNRRQLFSALAFRQFFQMFR
jgi:hypothetical protein